jgi:peroxiredoxin
MNRLPLCLLAAALSLSSPSGVVRASEPLAAATSVPASTNSAPQRLLTRGTPAPSFSVVGANGETIRLSDFSGKILILDVSATWCGPCQAAMPNNDRIARKYRDQGVVLLGVTADDTRANYDGWIKRNAAKYAFNMAFDPAGRDGWNTSIFHTAYQITSFPTIYVIGRDGKIIETLTGGGPGDDFRLEYALARAGAKVDLASLPPESARDLTASQPAPKGGAGPQPSGGSFTPERLGGVTRGTPIKDFSVLTSSGGTVRLSEFRSHPVLLHFNTAKGPQAWVGKLAQTYAAQGLQTLVVFSATEKAEFERWVAENPAPPFSVAWDPAGKAWTDNLTNTVFGVGMYPVTAVIDAEGKLWSGAIGMSAKVQTMTYSMLARNGIQLTDEHFEALVAAGGALPARGTVAR